MGRSADSGHSRRLITNSNQYGLTTGSYQAEYLELTPDGKLASGEEHLGRARLQARLELAIGRIEPFKALYDRYAGDRLPSMTVLRDVAIESGTAADNADECVQTFLANARDLGLARNMAGAERLLTFDHALLSELLGPPSVAVDAQEPRPPPGGRTGAFGFVGGATTPPDRPLSSRARPVLARRGGERGLGRRSGGTAPNPVCSRLWCAAGTSRRPGRAS